jgi:hypothetical protein
VVASAQCQVNRGGGDDSEGAGDEVDSDLHQLWAVDPGGRHGEGPASHWAVVTRGMIHLGHHLESGKGESQLAAAGARSGDATTLGQGRDGMANPVGHGGNPGQRIEQSRRMRQGAVEGCSCYGRLMLNIAR